MHMFQYTDSPHSHVLGVNLLLVVITTTSLLAHSLAGVDVDYRIKTELGNYEVMHVLNDSALD